MSNISIQLPGTALYALLDIELNGYITWTETKPAPIGEVIAVLMFTSGELAEQYLYKVMPARSEHISVCRVSKQLARTFVGQMLQSKINYVLLDVPPIAVDQLAEGELEAQQTLDRDYMIIDIKRMAARFMK